MSLQIRRGTDAQRLTITPQDGELIYCTDTETLWIGNGLTVGGIEVSGGAGGNVDLLHVPSDIIPIANNVQSLGNATNQWADLYVSNNTIYMNSVPLTIGTGNVLQVNGANVVTTSGSSNVADLANLSVTGTVTAGFFVGDGSGLTNLPAGDYSNANVSAYLPTDTTIISIQSNAANTNSNVANLTTSLGNTNSNVVNLTADLGNTNSNVTTLQGQVYTNANVAAYLPTYAGSILADDVTANALYTGNISGNPGDAYFVANASGTQFGFAGAGGIGVSGGGISIGGTGGANIFGVLGAEVKLGGSTGGQVTVSSALNSSNTITATSYYGDGSNLTGLYGNTEVAAYLPTYTGVVKGESFSLADAGALTTSVIRQNQNPPLGSEAFGIEMLTTTDTPGIYSSVSSGPDYVALQSSNAGNANVQLQGGYGVTINTSNATGGAQQSWTFTQAGDFFTPGDVSSLGNVFAQGEVSAIGNVYTDGYFIGNFQGNITGNITVPGSNTQVLFNTNGNVDAVGGLTYNKGSNTLTILGQISAQGNVFGGNFIGDGSQLTNLPIQPGTYANANVAAYLPTYSGDITATNVSATGNVIGDGSQLTNVNAVQVVNGTSNVTIPTANSNVVVTVNGTQQWRFDTNGDIDLPISTGPGSGGTIQSANSYPVLLAYGSNAHGGPEIDYINTDEPVANFFSNTVIRNTMYLNNNGLYIGINENQVANVAHPSWRFEAAGNLVAPGNISAAGNIRGANFTTAGQVYAEGNVTTESWILATNMGVQAYDLQVTNSASLGNVANITITGGTVNELLITDGAGNLSWSTVEAGSQIFVVDQNTGSDTTGDGSLSKPFQTLQAAHDFGANNTPTGQWVHIQVNPYSGYSGTLNVTYPLVYLHGTQDVRLYTDITVADTCTQFKADDIQLFGAFTALNRPTSSRLDFWNCTVGSGTWQVSDPSPSNTAYFYVFNSMFYSPSVTITGFTGGDVLFSSSYINTLTFDAAPYVTIAGGSVDAGLVLTNGSSVAVQSAGAADYTTVDVDATSTLSADASFLGPVTLTVASGGTLVKTTNAEDINGLGNIVATNLNGNVSTVLAGDGTWVAQSSGSGYGDSNVVTLLSSFGSNVISTTGNVNGGYAFFSDIQLNDLSANAILYTDANRNVFNTDFSYDSVNNLMSGGNISVTGNIIGNISQATGLGNISTVNLNANVSTVLAGDGTWIAQGGASVAEAPFSIQTAGFNAIAGSRYGIDTTGASLIAVLPGTPTTGDAVFFADAGGAYSTNNFIVDPDSDTIMNTAGPMTVSTNGQSFGLFWNGTTWRTYN